MDTVYGYRHMPLAVQREEVVPTANPSQVPVAIPSQVPTANPSQVPVAEPTEVPSDSPTPKKVDAFTQTLSVDNLVRQVLISKVADDLQNKGLQLIACAHTRGLHVSDIISDIVKSHSGTCAKRNQNGGKQGIPLQGDWLDEMFEPVYPIKRKCKSQVTKKKTKKPKGVKPVKKKAPEDKSDRMCPLCGKTFKYPSFVKAHMARHTTQRLFQCEKCDYKGKTKTGLRKHNRFVHEYRFPYFCKICGIGVRTKPKLIVHENTHLDKKDMPVQCMYCGKRFSCEYNLKKHLVFHGERSLIKCDLCSRSFFFKDTYCNHLKMKHGAVKSFKQGMICLTCDLDFNEWSALLKHMKDSHHGKTFRKSVRIKCDFCSMTYAYQGQKRKHMKKFHKLLLGEKCKKCLLCDLEFSKKDAIVEHMTSQHKEYVTNSDGGIQEFGSDESQKGGYIVEDLDPEAKCRPMRCYCAKCNIYIKSGSEYMKHKQDFHTGSENNMSKSGARISVVPNVSKDGDLNRTEKSASITQKVGGQDDMSTNLNVNRDDRMVSLRLISLKEHQITSQSSPNRSISLLATKDNLDKIKTSMLKLQCWMCGKKATDRNGFYKHISEEHKDQLVSDQDIAKKSGNLSSDEIDHTNSQSFIGKDKMTNGQSALEVQTSSQSHVQKDHATSQSATQLHMQVNKSGPSTQEGQTSSQSHVQTDHATSQSATQLHMQVNKSGPSTQEGQTSSQSSVQKDHTARQKALQFHMQLPLCKLPACNQTENTLHKSTVPKVGKNDQSNLQSGVPVKCELCPKMFVPSFMRQHLKDTHSALHTDEFKMCLVCNVEFKDWPMLVKHFNNNHCEQSGVYIRCELCPKVFLPSYLRQHLRDTHGALNTEEFKKCLVCDLEFKDWPMLVKHINIKHSKHNASDIRNAVAGNKCWVCQAELQERGLLVKHLKECHKIVLHVNVSS